MKPTIACAYRSAGNHSYIDAVRLEGNIKKHMTQDFDFVCLTDDLISLPTITENETLVSSELQDYPYEMMKANYSEPWCFIELFKLTGPVMVVDIDTVFTDSMEPLIQMIEDCTPENLCMTHSSNSIILWNGDWSWLYKKFDYPEWSGVLPWHYIHRQVDSMNLTSIEEYVPGIYSFKEDVRGKGLPSDAMAVLFRGTPRPSRVNRRQETWLQEAWF